VPHDQRARSKRLSWGESLWHPLVLTSAQTAQAHRSDSAAVVFVFVYAPILAPQSIFHVFAQQNRMSSPQNPPKTNNPNPINKIKLSQKRFLVMVNPVK
jgi:hypothetical protein